jgi:hypothetical protein
VPLYSQVGRPQDFRELFSQVAIGEVDMGQAARS